MSRRRWHLLAVLVGLGAGAGTVACDQAAYSEGSGVPEAAVFQPRTLRTLVASGGLDRLWDIVHPEGITLDAGAADVAAPGGDVTLGPLQDAVSVDDWGVTTEEGLLTLHVVSDDVDVVVPVRVEEPAGFRICRYRAHFERMTTRIEVGFTADRATPTLAPSRLPTLLDFDPQIELLGDCPPLETADPTVLDARIVDYLADAWLDAAGRAGATSPVEVLGLLDGRVELSRLSPFSNRRGRLASFGRIGQGAATIDAQGLRLDLDLAVDATRAPCAPPIAPDPPGTQPADPIDASSLQAARADIGVALGTDLLVQFAQHGVLAGFSCRGLEGEALTRPDETALPVEDLLLGEVGLGQVPTGAWARAVISPGELPRLETRPGTSDLQLVWRDLTVEFYADVRGVPVRLLQLTTSATISLRPTVGAADQLELSLDAVDVTDAALQSEWLGDQAVNVDLLRWSRRVLLLVLTDELTLPLPIRPGAPLRLSGAQVRDHDILLLLDLDAP